ncbi:Contactin-1 [Chelonia mydas]|uniref:Contactin-1 n=1 Tax=Chelonia mydas TaxID=8469 RepID=M7BM87_CHEMY|nr:Contactin-1 [Chelonia mydas]
MFWWKLNNWDIDLTKDRYGIVGGRLLINNPEKSKDAGKYVCIASNIFGTVRSAEATLSFGYLDTFPPEERYEVKVREGVGAVLLCEPPYHYPDDLSYRWLLNEFPVFITLDKRRFVSQTNGNLYIANVEASDKGNYSCFVSSPSITKSVFSKFIPLIPQAVDRSKVYPADIKVKFKDTYALLGQNVTLECFALGNPVPEIRWNKYLEPMPATAEISMSGAVLKILNIQFEDEGTYECEAENYKGKDKHQARVYVQASPPNFELNPMKKKILAANGGRVIIECKPKAAPKPKFSWSKGTELLVNGSRISIWDDGSLEIVNITKLDQGSYTCFAENNQGKANSTGTLEITEATKITLAPTNVDVTVGENATMQCIASYDTTLDLTFIWSLNGYMIDFEKEHDHYERSVMIKANGELLIKNVQLQHAGRYTCTAQTIVDNSSASADLVVRGPPGPPGGLRIEDIKDTSVTLTWSRGTDNHSPISKYTIQSKTFLSEEWKDAKTDPPNIEGNMETAKVIDLIPWMEYEFRITAMNTLGIGEPSMPSQRIRTEGAAPNVAPSDVGGGGGSNRELTITWVPLSREYHFGKNFGYIVAFKPFGEKEWRRVTVTNPDIGRYVHKDDSLPPSTKFQVKVKAFNNKGDGPFSLVAIIYSAQDAPSERPRNVNVKVLSSSEISVSWEHVFEQSVEGYQIRYWTVHDKEAAAQRVLVSNQDYSTKLENLKPSTRYHVDVCAFNSAGYGPPSGVVDIVTRKAPPSQRPRIISTVRSGSRYIITWDHVTPMSNESAVQGYKVLYRPDGQHEGTLYSTGTHSIDLPVPRDGEYVVEVRAHSEGGDGEVAQIKISGRDSSSAERLRLGKGSEESLRQSPLSELFPAALPLRDLFPAVCSYRTCTPHTAAGVDKAK